MSETNPLEVATGLLFTAHHVDHHREGNSAQLPGLEQCDLQVRPNESGDKVSLLLSQPMPHDHHMHTQLHTLITKPRRCVYALGNYMYMYIYVCTTVCL